LEQPIGISVDGNGTLWVADSNNGRVLGFENAATLGNGPAASRVLGQINFTFDLNGSGSNRFNGPSSVSVDAFGALWVCDPGNNRVLRFDNPNSGEVLPDADAVLGQPDLDGSSSGLAANRLDLAFGATIFLEPSGSLWVADVDNLRVLRFTRPVDPAVVVADTTRPKIKVRGRRSIETLRKRVVFRGTATDASGIAEIQVKTRKGAKAKKVKLRSRDRWKVVLRVTKDRGRVVVKFRAVDEVGNRSSFKRVRILRR
jgi:hypothetical protein